MNLTGIAKEDFNEWFKNKHTDKYTIKNLSLDLAKATTNAIIIEWFDSVGIYFEHVRCDDGFLVEIWTQILELTTNRYATRNLASDGAIIKANEIYNNRKS